MHWAKNPPGCGPRGLGSTPSRRVVETALVKRMHTEEARQAWIRTVPQRRYASPEEIAGTISFLLDESAASFITGQVICVDGGFTAGGLIGAVDSQA